MQTERDPDHPPPGTAAGGVRLRVALNRCRQRELYGSPLGDRVGRLTAVLGITQGRLAHTLGLSPAMLSQLASGRRVKIGDPAVLARLQLLDQRCGAGPPRGHGAVEALLAEVARARLQWTAGDAPLYPGPARPGAPPRPAGPLRPAAPPRPAECPADALRAVAPPARLVAAAAALASRFPELAEILREAAEPPGRRRYRQLG